MVILGGRPDCRHIITKLKCPDGPEQVFGNGQGIAVATILPDPSVDANPTRQIFLTHTKRLTIRGAGFALYADAELSIEPTKRDDCARYEWDDGNEFAGTKYDDEPVAHIKSTAHPKEPKEPRTIGDPGAGGIFVIVLQSVVYLIGLVFCCGGLTYVVVQKNSGKSVWSAVPTLDPATLDPKSSVQMKKLAVTPDTTYSGSA